MTPDLYAQALTKIDVWREENWLRGNMFRDWIDPKKESALTALKAVLELHKEGSKRSGDTFGYRKPDGSPILSLCQICSDSQDQPVAFPCPTADLIIEAVLGVTK